MVNNLGVLDNDKLGTHNITTHELHNCYNAFLNVVSLPPRRWIVCFRLDICIRNLLQQPPTVLLVAPYLPILIRKKRNLSQKVKS